MFPPATLPRLIASSLALLSLGVGPAAAQQQAAVVTVALRRGRPAFFVRPAKLCFPEHRSRPAPAAAHRRRYAFRPH